MVSLVDGINNFVFREALLVEAVIFRTVLIIYYVWNSEQGILNIPLRVSGKHKERTCK